jgi:phospholipid/cholesterol/gamma-HCH transport system substrate-binding protein
MGLSHDGLAHGPQLAQLGGTSSSLTLSVPHRVRWSNLRLGIASFAGVITIGALILTFARVGSLHGKTFTLYVQTDEARGVIRGTEVWLSGQRVGLVKSVDFQPPSTGAKDRVVMRLDVLENAREHIRLNSRTQIRSGGSLISSPVIYVHAGTARARAVGEGDTLRSEGSTDIESATARAAEAAKELPAILTDVKILSAQLRSIEGPLGAIRTGALPRLHAVQTQASRVIGRLSSKDGSVGSLLSGSGDVTGRARHALAGVDSLRAFLESDRTSFGRFRRDSTLTKEIGALRGEIATLRALAASPDGTIGRFRSDSAYRQAINDAFRQMDSLFADLRKHPTRYIAF